MIPAITSKNQLVGYMAVLLKSSPGLGGDKQYIRSVAEGRAYYPVTETITFASRLKAGHVFLAGETRLWLVPTGLQAALIV